MYSTKKKPKQENCVKILSHVFIKSFCEAFANGTSTLESDSMFFDTLVHKAGLLLDGNNLYWDYYSDEYPSVDSTYRTFTKQ